ncbi:ccr4-associated factor family protein [Besnoitia besnoiti]|uniref:poly(A)-specific ribonuclease n=1 Tax=Besnoitia besnoiti TaxID=94643 RepID=A0A2A9MD95_BESBE|nr:ccr4-associated factor family protein [Besnoitia besnoiti]PFH33350.1 ccr4-associated factor family protein [Besnoitia besnoiti]
MNGECGERGQIIEVWGHNLEEEFARIRDVVERYQYIAMDTEFPGIVARPTGNVTDYNYQTVKYNVDLLKVIQLGITFADAAGNLAEGTSTWQFNFRFDLNEDMYAQDSIDFLKQSGIDFDKQQKKGIDVQDFGELIMSSGLVMNEDVKWISFHGCYDFGYLLKLLTCAPLPQSEAQFFELLHDFFPALYDIKYLLRSIHNFNLSGGSSLQKVAEHLQVTRIGPQHQAGSDSLVTCRTFFKLVELYFASRIEDCGCSGVIYGLGMSLPKHSLRGGSNPHLPASSTYSGAASRPEPHAPAQSHSRGGGRGGAPSAKGRHDDEDDANAAGAAAASRGGGLGGASSLLHLAGSYGGGGLVVGGAGAQHANYLAFHHSQGGSHVPMTHSQQPGGGSHLVSPHLLNNAFSGGGSAAAGPGVASSPPEFVPSASMHAAATGSNPHALSLLASPGASNGNGSLAGSHASFLLGGGPGASPGGAQATGGPIASNLHSRNSRQILGGGAGAGGGGAQGGAVSSSTHLRAQ